MTKKIWKPCLLGSNFRESAKIIFSRPFNFANWGVIREIREIFWTRKFLTLKWWPRRWFAPTGEIFDFDPLICLKMTPFQTDSAKKWGSRMSESWELKIPFSLQKRGDVIAPCPNGSGPASHIILPGKLHWISIPSGMNHWNFNYLPAWSVIWAIFIEKWCDEQILVIFVIVMRAYDAWWREKEYRALG